MNHEDIERFEKVQDNTSKLRSREVRIFLEELRREEKSDKIKTTIRLCL